MSPPATVTPVTLEAARVACIVVPKASAEVATTDGKYLRRRLRYDGKPECTPMLPHDRASRSTSFGLSDASAQAVGGSRLADLDPLERERLRQSVRQCEAVANALVHRDHHRLAAVHVRLDDDGLTV